MAEPRSEPQQSDSRMCIPSGGSSGHFLPSERRKCKHELKCWREVRCSVLWVAVIPRVQNCNNVGSCRLWPGECISGWCPGNSYRCTHFKTCLKRNLSIANNPLLDIVSTAPGQRATRVNQSRQPAQYPCICSPLLGNVEMLERLLWPSLPTSQKSALPPPTQLA